MQRDAQEQNARSSRSPSSPAPTLAHAHWMLMGNTEGIRGCAYLERLRPKECFRYPLLQEEGRRKEAFFSFFFLSFSLSPIFYIFIFFFCSPSSFLKTAASVLV
ncbi:hypothetical protein TNCV_2331991 [Trichonephila clavipes]|nr:hypothetical protein TNCV_2331991 [Trichonephila clavipes]